MINNIFSNNHQGLLVSLLAHIVLIGLLFVVPDKHRPAPVKSAQSVKPVEAVVIDASRLDSELKKLRDLEQRKKNAEQQRIKKLQDQAKLAKKQRKQEERRLLEAQRKKEEAKKHKKKLEQQHIAAEKLEAKKQLARKRKATIEKKRLQQIKEKQLAVEHKRKLEEKRLVQIERKRELEEQRKRKLQLEAEQQRKAIAKRKQKEAEDAQRREAERELQASIAREQQARNARLIDEYVSAIKGKVQRNWLQYAGKQKGKSCVVRVKLMPGGAVLTVQITRSSGDKAFDQSVEQAVFRAAPLPVPTDADLFNTFRDVSFIFSPGE